MHHVEVTAKIRKLETVLALFVYFSGTLFVFMFSHSSADEEVLSNQRRSVFREAVSSQAETNAYISTSTASSVSVLKSVQSQVSTSMQKAFAWSYIYLKWFCSCKIRSMTKESVFQESIRLLKEIWLKMIKSRLPQQVNSSFSLYFVFVHQLSYTNVYFRTGNNDIVVSTFRLKDPEEETTCILMTVDALLSFIYPSNIDSKEV